jgi:hypothetical protein
MSHYDNFHVSKDAAARILLMRFFKIPRGRPFYWVIVTGFACCFLLAAPLHAQQLHSEPRPTGGWAPPPSRGQFHAPPIFKGGPRGSVPWESFHAQLSSKIRLAFLGASTDESWP